MDPVFVLVIYGMLNSTGEEKNVVYHETFISEEACIDKGHEIINSDSKVFFIPLDYGCAKMRGQR